MIFLLTLIFITQFARILQEERRWKREDKLYNESLREKARAALDEWAKRDVSSG